MFSTPILFSTHSHPTLSLVPPLHSRSRFTDLAVYVLTLYPILSQTTQKRPWPRRWWVCLSACLYMAFLTVLSDNSKLPVHVRKSSGGQHCLLLTRPSQLEHQQNDHPVVTAPLWSLPSQAWDNQQLTWGPLAPLRVSSHSIPVLKALGSIPSLSGKNPKPLQGPLQAGPRPAPQILSLLISSSTDLFPVPPLLTLPHRPLS